LRESHDSLSFEVLRAWVAGAETGYERHPRLTAWSPRSTFKALACDSTRSHRHGRLDSTPRNPIYRGLYEGDFV